MVAVPLTVREKAVAVLYADSAGLDAEAVNLEALETLVHVTGMSIELLAARKPQAAAEGSSAAAAPAPETSRTDAEERHPAPIMPAVSEPAPEPAVEAWRGAEESGEAEAADAPVRVEEPEYTEDRGFSMTPRAGDGGSASAASFEPMPEASPAFMPAQAAAPPPATHAEAEPSSQGETSAPRRRYGSNADLPVEVSAEERPVHDRARRFARLLVSEIKLYNEQKVKEGLGAGDLYGRLREDIDRSREMYDKRFGEQLNSRYDYFHNELVSTLAGGDQTRLGDNYPGASGAG
jgi:hypothetical protein